MLRWLASFASACARFLRLLLCIFNLSRSMDNALTTSEEIFAEIMKQFPFPTDLLSVDVNMNIAHTHGSVVNVDEESLGHSNNAAWDQSKKSAAHAHFEQELIFHAWSPAPASQAPAHLVIRTARGKCARRERKIRHQPSAAAQERIDKRVAGICTIKSCKQAALATYRRCQRHLAATNAAKRRLRADAALARSLESNNA